MILDKIYRNKGIGSSELVTMVSMFFKIHNVNVKDTQIKSFIKYMISMNDHPLAPHFKKFISVNELIHNELVPTIENNIDVVKIYDKEGRLLNYTFNNKKYQKLF